VLTGWIYDRTQSYTYALIGFIICYAAAGSSCGGCLTQATNEARGRRIARQTGPLDRPPPAVHYLGAGGSPTAPHTGKEVQNAHLGPLLTAILLLSPVAGQAQTLQDVATALGAANLKSIEIQGSGVTFQVGQSQAPGTPWPQFNAKSFARLVNYDTASLREEAVRIRALEPPRGGGPYVRGEQRQVFVLSGDHTWNVVADAAVPAPITLADRQFQLWSTPHGVVKAALGGRGSMQGRTIAFAVPGRFRASATVDAANLIERVDATLTNPVLGDMAVVVSYSEYRDSARRRIRTRASRARWRRTACSTSPAARTTAWRSR
jgi:hypothetical protein